MGLLMLMISMIHMVEHCNVMSASPFIFAYIVWLFGKKNELCFAKEIYSVERRNECTVGYENWWASYHEE